MFEFDDGFNLVVKFLCYYVKWHLKKYCAMVCKTYKSKLVWIEILKCTRFLLKYENSKKCIYSDWSKFDRKLETVCNSKGYVTEVVSILIWNRWSFSKPKVYWQSLLSQLTILEVLPNERSRVELLKSHKNQIIRYYVFANGRNVLWLFGDEFDLAKQFLEILKTETEKLRNVNK